MEVLKMETVQVATRLDKNIKLKANQVLEREGLDLPLLFKIVATKTANEGIVPIMFRQDYRKMQAEAALSEIIKPMLKNAKHIDPKNKADMKEMFDGWED